MLLNNIKFPVFSIGTHKKLWYENNILYLLAESAIIYKLDNKNLAGNTLGKRLLKINKNDRYRFTGAYLSFAQMVKSNKSLFIDNEGYVFRYKKSKRVNLIYRTIIKKRYIEDKGILLYVRNISSPFLVSPMVYNNEEYIGLLSIDGGHIIYEFSDERKPDTWRKI